MILIIFHMISFASPVFQKTGKLFYVVPLFPYVGSIQQCLPAYLKKSLPQPQKSEKGFLSLPCSEMKEKIRKELNDLCGNLRPHHIYIIETHDAVIKLIYQFLAKRDMEVVSLGTLRTGSNLLDLSIQNLYKEKWENNCETCPHSKGHPRCSVAPGGLLDKESRKMIIWAFRIKK